MREVFSREEVSTALQNMAGSIRRLSCTVPQRPLVLISLLKGGLWTGYQLLNRIQPLVEVFPDIRVGHMGISSYGGGTVPGEVKVTHTLDLSPSDLEGSVVWIVDDIWDSGNTMKVAMDRVKRLGGIDLYTCVLVYRYNGCAPDFPNRPNIWGLKYEGSEFLAGCGMGMGELHRHHPSIFAEVTEDGASSTD